MTVWSPFSSASIGENVSINGDVRMASVNELIAVAVHEHLSAVNFRTITVKGELVGRRFSLDQTSDLMECGDKRK